MCTPNANAATSQIGPVLIRGPKKEVRVLKEGYRVNEKEGIRVTKKEGILVTKIKGAR